MGVIQIDIAARGEKRDWKIRAISAKNISRIPKYP